MADNTSTDITNSSRVTNTHSMKKLENTIKKLIINATLEGVSKASIDQSVASVVAAEVEKLRYDYLPHGACWMCSMPVSRRRGYSMWKGKMFCTEQCLRKYHSLMQNPANRNRTLEGEPIEEFKPNEL